MDDGDTISRLKCTYPDCGHEWYPRTSRVPKVCPRCKRYSWDKPPAKKLPSRRKKVSKGGSNVSSSLDHIRQKIKMNKQI